MVHRIESGQPVRKGSGEGGLLISQKYALRDLYRVLHNDDVDGFAVFVYYRPRLPGCCYLSASALITFSVMSMRGLRKTRSRKGKIRSYFSVSAITWIALLAVS